MIDANNLKKIDKSGMLANINEFPQQLEEGWKIGSKGSFSLGISDFHSIVFSGMGGSAIAGDLIKAIVKEIPIPFKVNRSYTIPDYADSNTLFIASSYSGNTEETLSALRKAIEKKCYIICITSGGQVASLGQKHHYPIYKMVKGYQPRAALGYSLGIMLSLLKSLGCKTLSHQEIDKTIQFLKDILNDWKDLSSDKNLPLTIAGKIKGKIPLIYGSVDTCGAVALRWKTQFNENSKTHAFSQFFSEMNHNEIVGWEVLPPTKHFFPHLCAVFLRAEDDLERNRYRMDITKSLLNDAGIDNIDIQAEGFSLFSRLMYLVLMGDLLSYYLAILYGIDPTEIKKINLLKQKLS